MEEEEEEQVPMPAACAFSQAGSRVLTLLLGCAAEPPAAAAASATLSHHSPARLPSFPLSRPAGRGVCVRAARLLLFLLLPAALFPGGGRFGCERLPLRLQPRRLL